MARYNSSVPYDYPIDYDEAGVYVLVGQTEFSLDSEIDWVSAGASVFPPITEMVLTGFIEAILVGNSVVVPLTELDILSSISFFKVSTIKFSGEPIPAEHMEDAQKLDADAYIELFQIILSDKQSKIYLKLNKTGTWGGNQYEGTGIKMDGVAKYADEQVARPKVTIYNPEGIYSYLVDQGLLDAATIVRYRVLKYDYENDRPIYRRQQWKVSRVASLKKGYIGLELRDMMDGQNFLTPARMFIPPDFPTVSLQ